MITHMCLSEIWNFIFNMEEKAVMLDLLVVTGFCSRGLFHLPITQASPDLSWGEIGPGFVLVQCFSNPKLWDRDKMLHQKPVCFCTLK